MQVEVEGIVDLAPLTGHDPHSLPGIMSQAGIRPVAHGQPNAHGLVGHWLLVQAREPDLCLTNRQLPCFARAQWQHGAR